MLSRKRFVLLVEVQYPASRRCEETVYWMINHRRVGPGREREHDHLGLLFRAELKLWHRIQEGNIPTCWGGIR